MKHKTHIVGALDKRGKKIVTVSTEGWYKTEDGCIYDNNGYEWFINKPNDDASKQRIEVDDLSGGVKTIRDFKVAVMQNSFLNPDKFIAHWKKTIEATMVETGWDYDDETKLLITSLSLLAISAYAQPSIPAGGMSTPTVRVGQQTRDLVGDRESQSQTHGVVASPSNSVGNPRIPEIQAPNGSSNSSALPESLVIPGTVELAPDYVVH